MAVKKSDIYRSIWSACDKLRGGVEPARYKDYILTLLFVKYVSDRYKGNEWSEIIVPKGGSFDDLKAVIGKPSIGEDINKAIAKLAEANDLRGVIDIADFNDSDQLGKGKDMVDKLSDLISIFDKPELCFRGNNASGDDIIGDAYEYLMKNFAVDSGKSKGQFYTPAEVSRIIAKVLQIESNPRRSVTIYDPACGSGSLLIRAAEETDNATVYGQEKDNATVGLAKMNFVLHNLPTAEVFGGNTLADPHFKNKNSDTILQQFDYVVSNPPFSLKAWTDGVQDPDVFGRFDGFDKPPEKNGDYAWLLHVIKSMKSASRAAIILPHGVLFRGNAEGTIRQKLIKKGYIKGIIGLPANLFFGTGIPACIIILEKSNVGVRKGIFMIDASKYYIKDGNKNRLREQDIKRIVDTWTDQLDIPNYSRFVMNDEIETRNTYNLNIPRYIDSSECEDAQDISGHLKGGIPNRDIDSLSRYWTVMPSLRSALFTHVRKGYSEITVPKDRIVATISGHSEFLNSAKMVENAFISWRESVRPILLNISAKTAPKALITEISEMILSTFNDVPLIDKYDVYQVLLSYWEDTMSDDIYTIVANGFESGRNVENIVGEHTSGKNKGKARVIGWDGRLIPKELMITKYFNNERKAMIRFDSDLDALKQLMRQQIKEEGDEEGLLSEVIEKDEITQSRLNARLKLIRGKSAYSEEYEALLCYKKLIDDEKTYKTSIKNAQSSLEVTLFSKYETLTKEEILDILFDRKWFNAIYTGINALFVDTSHRLSNRIIELVERYEETLPNISEKVVAYESIVKAHLERMGFVW